MRISNKYLKSDDINSATITEGKTATLKHIKSNIVKQRPNSSSEDQTTSMPNIRKKQQNIHRSYDLKVSDLRKERTFETLKKSGVIPSA